MSKVTMAASRRRLLQYLAASPLLARTALAEEGLASPRALTDPMIWAPNGIENVIKTAREAIDVFDFEPVCFKNVPPAHFGYMASGADGESTLRANRADFAKFTLRNRRLRKPEPVDARIALFGTTWNSPIFTAPTGYNKAFHPDGEIGVTKAAEAGGFAQLHSAAANASIEEITKLRKSPPWFQLYALTDLDLTKTVVERVERAGTPVMAITVDNIGLRKLTTQERLRRLDRRNCLECHKTPQGGTGNINMAAYAHIDRTVHKNVAVQAGLLDWDYVRRIRDMTRMKVIIKGILDSEDAALAVRHGFDGVVVSNHGGRTDDTGTSTISVLPDVVAAVKGRIPVLIDGGFRRGTDVVKALAMGAAAVGIGKPYLWGLGAFGQEGVEGVLRIMQAEMIAAMAQVGASSIKGLDPKSVHRA